MSSSNQDDVAGQQVQQQPASASQEQQQQQQQQQQELQQEHSSSPASSPTRIESTASTSSTGLNGSPSGLQTAPIANSCISMTPSADDNLICRWGDCGERFAAAESLYDHICERHVGRKSTNNLNLTCNWNSCRTTTVKRDHITSHIRVHVPLKPHKCDLCGKSFKRPQDLKKHVKTHADESVLVRSPPDHAAITNGYRPHSKAPNFYDHSNQQMNDIRHVNPAHFASPTGPATSYYHQQAQYQPNVYYAANLNGPGRPDFLNDPPSFEQRKRPLDDLNDFFGSVKRGRIDTRSYSEISRAIGPIASLALGSAGVATEYMPQAPHTLAMANLPHVQHVQHVQHVPHVPHVPHGAGLPYQHYSLPQLPSLRGKEALAQIDDALAAMQATVYEHNGTTASAHYAEMRNHSPTYSVRHMTDAYAVSSVSAAQMASPLTAVSSTHSTGTPVATPPSSTMSYAGHSPAASSVMSPMTRHSSTASVSYPILSSRPSLPFPNTTGLGSSFGHNERRISGGVLQTASGGRRGRADHVETAVTPRAPEPTTAVSSPSAASATSETEAESYEDWVQYMRFLEDCRHYIRQLRGQIPDGLQSQDGDGDDRSTSGVKEEPDHSRVDPMILDQESSSKSSPDAGKPLYPELPRIE